MGIFILLTATASAITAIELPSSYNAVVAALTAGGLLAAILILLLMFVIVKNRRRIHEANEYTEFYKNAMQAFLDAGKSMAFLKDENFNYLMVNHIFEKRYKRTRAEIIGKDDFSLIEAGFAQWLRESDKEILQKNTLVEYENESGGLIYESIKFPVKMPGGGYGIGAYISDKTIERGQMKLREQIHERNRILADALSLRAESKEEQIDFVLKSALSLTQSEYGYFYYYNENTGELRQGAWVSGTADKCEPDDDEMLRRFDEAGIWEQAIGQRKSVTINNLNQNDPLRKGYSGGGIEIKKLICVPIIWEEQIVALAGMANKKGDYDVSDTDNISILVSGLWQAVIRSRMRELLAYERNKYLQTLVSIGDGVMVVDRDGRVEMLNGVAQKLTGWSDEEARGRPYTEVFVLSNENPGLPIEDPVQMAIRTKEIQELRDFAVLTSRSGTISCLEDSAAPILNESGEFDGVVVVFRDVTEKRAQSRRIEYLSFHDMLTDLYNRRFFEEELRRIDTKRNIPISIVMGDVNSLKLTNDVFGHSSGDALLKTIADVFRKNCRADDIIARWGGDEFIVLLPKTGKADAERIAARIKKDFADRKITAFKGSIAIGIDTKENEDEDLKYILDRAEGHMYAAKTLESDAVRDEEIKSVLDMLHNNIESEERHSRKVAELCVKIGRALGLAEVDLRNLSDLGHYHDIGKVVLDPVLFEPDHKLNEEERKEIMRHPFVGYRILNASEKTVGLADAVLSHHEHWDGSGYPRGLKGEQIPLLARILAVAELYDRLTAGTNNMKALSDADAAEYLENKSGKILDPHITTLFVSMLKTEK
ncbi:MAG: diguanylate cyclase [Clostridiales bacterium]|nr:diguanylate cyclase [Clostridiales bacterium]